VRCLCNNTGSICIPLTKSFHKSGIGTLMAFTKEDLHASITGISNDSVNLEAGSIVTCRDRIWIILPAENSDVVRLRPLSGKEDQICGIYRPLALEAIAPAKFPLPQPETIQDRTAMQLLMDAARLSLRSGAGPFRCLGRLSVRPRPYQLVPLLMALRLSTVRLLVADDVGIGKTIEAGLIARELLDRGEVKRLAVLCPPQLCDQWQRELQEKFQIDAVVIRSGTASKLERAKPESAAHIFEYYRHIIVSLDYAKSERRRASFITHCPDLVIVDEAHTCTRVNSEATAVQQRHQLIQKIAETDRHLVLLTATPHSGIEASFLSLLGLLKPEFAQLNLDSLTEQARSHLANHFVQRRRADVKLWLGNETPFPVREALELPYRLTKEYRSLFENVYDLARGLVKTADDSLSYAQRRGRYWSALALIRCVMSSPAAAIATLTRQASKAVSTNELVSDLDEELLSAYVHDPTEQEQAVDAAPTVVVEQGQQFYGDPERRKLKAFVQEAAKLQGEKDHKLHKAIATVESLLKDGFNPIVWCRYIATANYVATALKKLEKSSHVRVLAITGEQSEDERESYLADLQSASQRVMVATDCLSEGVNLQEHFSAVIHYDLPWNPNRLEQREGRVDRYGQTVPVVKTYLLYGQDNPVDGAVLDVLIRKAVQIHKSLGITVPVPMDSASVTEAVFKSLFDRATDAVQLSLLDLLNDEDSAVELHKSWDQAVEREKISRTRFAQRAIKPEEVERELIDSDEILGNEQDVERFVQSACSRLNFGLIQKKQGWLLPTPPEFLQPLLGNKSRLLTFTTPAPEGVEYVGRNHPLVEGLARYILEDALLDTKDPIAARCGFTTTDAVQKRTTLLLLRLRHLLDSPNQTLLAEECAVVGFTGSPSHPLWLSPQETTSLLQQATPISDVPQAIKQMELQELLGRITELEPDLELFAGVRSRELSQSHRRVRAITKEGQILQVKPQLPMDILGVYILQPGRR
jgi:superfamily II DNA or RNA helicase